MKSVEGPHRRHPRSPKASWTTTFATLPRVQAPHCVPPGVQPNPHQPNCSARLPRGYLRGTTTLEPKVPRTLRTAMVATSTTKDSGPTDSSARRGPPSAPGSTRLTRQRDDSGQDSEHRAPPAQSDHDCRGEQEDANEQNVVPPRSRQPPAGAGWAGSATTAVTRVTIPGTNADPAVTRPAPANHPVDHSQPQA